MEKAALYARVSSEEQLEGYSIDAQRRAFKALCDSKGWTPYQEYIDEGKSAHSDNIDNRPNFKSIINDALAGNFDIFVVHKLDRFARHLPTTLDYFDKLQKANVSFVSISEQMDFTNPIGKVQLALLGAFAQYYSDNLSLEVKKGWTERRAQGLYCGPLPFGVMKGKDGVPVPDIRERISEENGQKLTLRNHDGLVMAFQMAARGKSDREVALALNTAGYRTSGHRGSWPFSKVTIRGVLSNKFYLGYLPDENSGWIKGKHAPLIDEETFNTAQKLRAVRNTPKLTVNTHARIYSLTAMMWCNQCGSKMRIQTNPGRRARIYCAARAESLGCKNKGTFLSDYEAQVLWYLERFVIPKDYREKILAAHQKLESAYNDTPKRRQTLQSRLKRIKQLFEWGHISEKEYMREYQNLQQQLAIITPTVTDSATLERLAGFLGNIADAWKRASQEQRNGLARSLFEQIRVEGNKVVCVKPRAELAPFFNLSYDCQLKDIAYNSERG